MSYICKICDSIHGFIRFGELEKEVIDSRPFQRLRYIHQMAIAYLVYPGATHSRFEHSLGVMELVTRIYNTLIEPHHLITPLKFKKKELDYWRLILRLAALCHDMGHLPFSHTAESSLLPCGGHESMTLQIIYSPELKPIWQKISSDAAEDIAKLSIGGAALSPWEKVLSKIITEDNFGADRIDYLIRDSRYTGVGYGYFDYHQLIDCLRILPEKQEFNLGITASGIQSVESLWIARYMMYARVYQHPKTRIYTHHMHHFMRRLFSEDISREVESYLHHTDYTVLSAMAEAVREGDYDAKCLFKQATPFQEIFIEASSLKKWKEELENAFGEAILVDENFQKTVVPHFLVLSESGELLDCLQVSSFLREIPCGTKSTSLYVHPNQERLVRHWLSEAEKKTRR